MQSYLKMSRQALLDEQATLQQRYDQMKGLNLSLDMTRGKPGSKQLDLSMSLLDLPGDQYMSEEGDCRNYGITYGIKEMRALFADMIGTKPELVIAGNNSSLEMMYDTLMRAMVFGEVDSDKPWSAEPERKWLCPVPGYDRHFLITEKLGFEMINVPMNEDGPDMDEVERLVKEDPTIKGIWCIPLYSNPDGYVFSEEVCTRLTSMKTAAQDFRVLWDNAYSVHHLYEDCQGSIPDILALAEKHGHPNRVYAYASMSKVTFSGSGVACMAANKDNIEYLKKHLLARSIGPDKINQLRHVQYLKDLDGIKELMKNHAQVIVPKFEKVEEVMCKELDGTDVARWNNPLGGYFISVYVMEGTARKVVALAKDAGVVLTPAGATFPYGKDPKDTNIRLAPTFPALSDIEDAVTIFSICAKLAAVEKLLEA